MHAFEAGGRGIISAGDFLAMHKDEFFFASIGTHVWIVHAHKTLKYFNAFFSDKIEIGI
jgi:hypothetical protein